MLLKTIKKLTGFQQHNSGDRQPAPNIDAYCDTDFVPQVLLNDDQFWGWVDHEINLLNSTIKGKK